MTMARPDATRVTLFLSIACAILIGLCIPVEANNGPAPVCVQAGQSIQAAIDNAPSGTEIVVEKGTYKERLTITKDYIELIGQGAVLVPPADSASQINYCSDLAGPGTQAGICIQGSNIQLSNLSTFNGEHLKVLSVGMPIKGVSVSGFEVHQAGLNIAVVGGLNTRIKRNTLLDGQRYGVLTDGSTNSHISGNTVTWTQSTLPFIGICMDDKAGPRVTHNHISGFSIALCVQTAGAYIAHNDVMNCCFGAFVDPLIKGAQLLQNHISSSRPLCATDPTSFGVYGIFITGSVDTKVEYNLIENITDFGRADRFAAGIALFDDPPTPEPTVNLATGNILEGNVLRNNDLDLIVLTNGTGNVVKGNQCTSSAPVGLCSM